MLSIVLSQVHLQANGLECFALILQTYLVTAKAEPLVYTRVPRYQGRPNFPMALF